MAEREIELLHGKSVLAVLVILFIALLGPLAVMAQPMPIGDPAYHQANPFDSRPTAGSYSGVGTVQGAIDSAFDGDLATSIAFYYGATPSGFVEMQGFKKPSDNGLADFAVTWIDIKVSYKAASTTTNDDQYRIVAYVDPSATPIVLQDWVTGYDARYDVGNGLQGHRAFSDVGEPIDGVWTWTDLASLRVRFETEQVGTNNFQRVTLYEVWVTAYSTPYPSANTISVQPSAVMGLHAGDVFFVDIYVTDVEAMWGYQIVLNFSSGVLTAIEYFSYGPFVSALPSEIGPDYVALAYYTYYGAPEGFTGSTPVARIYFVVNMDGASVLDLTKADTANFLGETFLLKTRDGIFASNPRHDVAVTEVSAGPTNVLPGEMVEINATVMNQGTFLEAFEVTAFIDSNPIDTETLVGVLSGDSEDLTFIWDTVDAALGFHQIKVEATLTLDEAPSNNVRIWDVVPEGVLVGRHDIAVTNVICAYSNGTVVPAGETLNVTRGDNAIINVTVANLGDFPEIFNVTVVWQQDTYGIENRTNVSLDLGIAENLTFVWNTDITSPPWHWPLDRWGNPINFTIGEIEVFATPYWIDGWLTVKGVSYEKGLDYDYTRNNNMTDGRVRINRNLMYPKAGFSVNKLELFVGEPAEFYGSPPWYSETPPGTTIVNYMWDFGDGNVTEGNFPTIAHAYISPGQYSVNLTVTNNLGLSSSVVTGERGAPASKMMVDERNVKIAAVAVSQTTVVIGQSVTISVTVKNDGVRDETLLILNKNITVYYDDVVIGSVRTPDLGAWNTATNNKTVVFNWDTSGVSPGAYTIKAVLDDLPYENNTADNKLTYGTVTLFQWDYVFTDNARGTTLKINLDNKFFQFSTPTKDYGLKQDPNMDIQANKITIRFEDAELRLRSMIIDTKKTTCSARAEDVQTGETFWLVQRPPHWTVGDVSYDGKVGVLDAGTVSAHWGPGPSSGPLGYDPNADINNDGMIDVLDAAIVSAHWGETAS